MGGGEAGKGKPRRKSHTPFAALGFNAAGECSAIKSQRSDHWRQRFGERFPVPRSETRRDDASAIPEGNAIRAAQGRLAGLTTRPLAAPASR
jgi:hypothetical protein